MWTASRSREAMLHMNTTYSPGESGQWTVVGITLRGRGRCPGDTRGKPCPGHDNLSERAGRALIVCSLTGIKTVSRGGEGGL